MPTPERRTHASGRASPFLPPVPGPWLPLTSEETTAFVQRLDLHLAAAGLADPPFSSQCTILDLHAVPLTFYPGWLIATGLVRMPTSDLANFDVLMGPGFFWCIDGSSPMIHHLNAGRVPRRVAGDKPDALALTPSPLVRLAPRSTGADYLRFFCHAVRGEHGCFRVVQTADDLRDSGVIDIARLTPMLKPLRATWADARQAGKGAPSPRGKPVVDKPADAPEPPRAIHVSTPVLYGGALFKTVFEVKPTGAIAMIRDEPLANDVAPTERTKIWLRAIRAAAPDAGPTGGRS